MKRFIRAFVFFAMTTFMLCGLFSMLRFLGITCIDGIPSGEAFLKDIKINFIISAMIAIYVVFKDIDKEYYG